MFLSVLLVDALCPSSSLYWFGRSCHSLFWILHFFPLVTYAFSCGSNMPTLQLWKGQVPTATDPVSWWAGNNILFLLEREVLKDVAWRLDTFYVCFSANFFKFCKAILASSMFGCLQVFVCVLQLFQSPPLAQH